MNITQPRTQERRRDILTTSRTAEKALQNRKRIYGFLVGGLLLAAVSRGFFELFLDKRLAYLVQFIATIGSIAVLLPLSELDRHRLRAIGPAFFTVILATFASAAVSAIVSASYVGVFYMAIIGTLFSIIAVLTVARPTPGSARVLADPILGTTCTLFFVASLQQLGLLPDLPGISWVFGETIRPSSLTGSMLHYPLIMALSTYCLFHSYQVYRAKRYLVGAVVGALAVFFSYSRSGVLILSFGGFAILTNVSWRQRFTIVSFVCLLLGSFALVGWMDLDGNFSLARITERTASSIDFQESANFLRIEIWRSTLDEILKTPVIISSAAGLYSNAAGNFGFVNEAVVAESSFLQLTLNFGIVCSVAAYVLLFRVYLLAKMRSNIISLALLGAVVQSLIYQSIEVLPVVLFIGILSWFAGELKVTKDFVTTRRLSP